MARYLVEDPGDIKFVASITKVSRAPLLRLVDKLETFDAVERGFDRIMFCPLTAEASTKEVIEDLAAQYDIHVSLDSGGYESQIGDEYAIREIYQFDLDYYTDHDWPDEYVLPDLVPVNGDDDQTVEHKVYDTISLARQLHAELPDDKQAKAVPVVQGHTKNQIVECLEAYREFDHVSKIGFGSFSTGGVNGGVNYLTSENIELLQFVVQEARKYDLDVHAFGVGGPTSIPIIYRSGVDTFDSTGWMRSAGYGNVFFPFKSRFNITHLRDRSGPTMYQNQLQELKAETGHECPFCDSFERLHNSRDARVLHNLIVMRDMCDMVCEMSFEEVAEMMNSDSKYSKYLEPLIEMS